MVLKIEDLKIAPEFSHESSKPSEKEKEKWKGHGKYEHRRSKVFVLRLSLQINFVVLKIEDLKILQDSFQNFSKPLNTPGEFPL